MNKRKNKHPGDLQAIFLIFIGVSFICYAWFNSPTLTHYNPEATPATHHNISESKAISALPKKPDSVHDTEKSYTQKEVEEYVASRSDLAAQWAMAKYTYVGLFIGGLGLIFLMVTVFETQKAAGFAEATLAETKDTAKRQLRAYITLSESEGGSLPDRKQNTTGIVARFRFQNDGQTPARDVMIEQKWTRLKTGESISDRWNESGILQKRTRTDYDISYLGAGKLVTACVDYPAFSPIRVKINQCIIVLTLYISFTDIYGERWCNEHYFTWDDKDRPLEEREAYQYKVTQDT